MTTKTQFITKEAAHAMGAKGAKPTEDERLLFEAWMRGHCWCYADTWDGTTYQDGPIFREEKVIDPLAVCTRQLWAAWRDRGALANAEVDSLTAETTRLELIITYQHDSLRAIERERNTAQADAKRYQAVRRGQKWSVIDGIGNELRAEKLDAAIDAAQTINPASPPNPPV